MCLIKNAFVVERNLDVIKMHGTTIKIIFTSFQLWAIRYISDFLRIWGIIIFQMLFLIIGIYSFITQLLHAFSFVVFMIFRRLSTA